MLSVRIGIIDDELNIRQIVEAYVQKEGFEAVCFETAEEALNYWQKETIDFWGIDIMLPKMDGYHLCKKIREKSEVPIIIISAKDEEIDKVLGIELGSDDYLTKPFSPRELIARIKRQLYRWNRYQTQGSESNTLEIGSLKLDRETRDVIWQDDKQICTTKEFELLAYFVENKNRALARESILQAVWGMDYIGSDRAVDDLIKRLRKKIPAIPIESIWGFGYRYKVDEHHET